MYGTNVQSYLYFMCLRSSGHTVRFGTSMKFISVTTSSHPKVNDRGHALALFNYQID